ncbi:MAG: hypothetical protein ACRD96_15990 [Bryobacteraceae bacterium]
MKRVLICLVLTLPLVAGDKPPGHFYAGFGVAAPTIDIGNGYNTGVGGEGFVWRDLAVGSDVAYVFPRRSAGSGYGLWSINPAWHFGASSRWTRVVPFVTTGYSLAFRSGVANMINYGGGATWWMNDRLGLRFEIRDHRTPQYENFHFVTFRTSIAFR